MRRRRRPSLNAQESPDGKLNGMEYKNYEEWGADAQKIQADLEDADHKLKQALIDGNNGSPLIQSPLIPLKSATSLKGVK